MRALCTDRAVALAIASFAAVLGGCKQLPKMPDLKKVLPEVRFDELKIDHIDFEGLDAKVVLDVTNPYPLGLDLTEASWKLGLAGSPFLDGTNDKGLSIAANETSKLRLPFSLKYRDAFRVVADAKGKDQLPFSFDADLGFSTPVGAVTVPFAHEGELPALHLPRISVDALRIEGLDLAKQTASLAVDLGVRSDQGSALEFDAFDYELALSGTRIADGIARIGTVDGNGTVTLPVDVRLVSLGASIVDVLVHKTPADVRLTADASIATPFGAVPLSFDESARLTPR